MTVVMTVTLPLPGARWRALTIVVPGVPAPYQAGCVMPHHEVFWRAYWQDHMRVAA